MPSGQSTVFSLRTNAAGSAPFRWYSAPDEGAGLYEMTVMDAKGQSASVSWSISPATQPHVLVFPHDAKTEVGAEYYLSGFPANSTVELGLYRLDESGQGTMIASWSVQTDAEGAFKTDFGQIFGREDGQYALAAIGGPVFKLAGIDAALSAIDFFSYNSVLDERYEVYSLNLNRGEAAPVAAQPTPKPETQVTPEVQPTPKAQPTPTFPPQTATLDEDLSPKPACPETDANARAACVLPATVPQGTFTYMLMQGYPPGARIRIRVTQPNKKAVVLRTKADADGFAQAHWYALHNEPLGEYKVRITGGGETFDSAFTVVEPVGPSLVVQPRSPAPKTPAIVSFAGFEPGEKLVLTRYRSEGAQDGKVSFSLLDWDEVRADNQGGGQAIVRKGQTKGAFYLVRVYRPGDPEPVAEAVYLVGEPLYLRYPVGWAQNFVEGQ